MLSLRTSPSTRIKGGDPVDKCKSDASCCTLKASSSVISIENLGGVICQNIDGKNITVQNSDS